MHIDPTFYRDLKSSSTSERSVTFLNVMLPGDSKTRTLSSDKNRETLIMDQGYKPATGLYYAPAPGLVVPPVSGHPTHEEYTT